MLLCSLLRLPLAKSINWHNGTNDERRRKTLVLCSLIFPFSFSPYIFVYVYIIVLFWSSIQGSSMDFIGMWIVRSKTYPLSTSTSKWIVETITNFFFPFTFDSQQFRATLICSYFSHWIRFEYTWTLSAQSACRSPARSPIFHSLTPSIFCLLSIHFILVVVVVVWYVCAYYFPFCSQYYCSCFVLFALNLKGGNKRTNAHIILKTVLQR